MSRYPLLLAAMLAAAGAASAQVVEPAPLPPPAAGSDRDDALDNTVDATQPPPPEDAPLTDTDDSFIDAALKAGQKEIAAAQLARDRAVDQAVRELAAMLETEHRAANDALVGLRAGTTSPTSTLDAADGDAGLLDLKSLRSGDFDGAWLDWQAGAHAISIARFERTAANAAHSDAVRKFAQDMLPTLRMHADRIAVLRGERAIRVAEEPAD
jgi:putative membrane protein